MLISQNEQDSTSGPACVLPLVLHYCREIECSLSGNGRLAHFVGLSGNRIPPENPPYLFALSQFENKVNLTSIVKVALGDAPKVLQCLFSHLCGTIARAYLSAHTRTHVQSIYDF